MIQYFHYVNLFFLCDHSDYYTILTIEKAMLLHIMR